MKCELSFEEPSTKELLSKVDFEYFLQCNVEESEYPAKALEAIHVRFASTTAELRKRSRKRPAQLHLYAEGQVRKMFNGGLLPTLFHLNDIREMTIGDFDAMGDNWAYFNHWQRRYKRTVTRAKVWNIVVGTGSILAFILSFIELLKFIRLGPEAQ